MPLVFVHGVSNRDGGAYRESEAGRNGFLREIVAPALNLSADALNIHNPYWGQFGARFSRNMSVLPKPGDTYETFGALLSEAPEAEMHARLVGLIAESPILTGEVVADAKSNFSETVDVLYAAALAGVTSEEQSRELARSYLRCAAYADATPAPTWVQNTTPGNFVDQLEYAANTRQAEVFGAGGMVDTLKEALSRLINAAPDAASSLGGRLLRTKLNAAVTRFTGDAFTYFTHRGTQESPGPIVATVLDALHAAAAEKRSQADNKLIVIAHSFGGEIMYDILTYFAPELEVDVLVTVGSQVGLFEEMKLYKVSSKDLPSAPQEKVDLPAGVTRWLNVFDTNDVLSYRLEPVITGVTDFFYDTGYSVGGAHGGYFLRPSFYKRLAERLSAE